MTDGLGDKRGTAGDEEGDSTKKLEVHVQMFDLRCLKYSPSIRDAFQPFEETVSQSLQPAALTSRLFLGP